MAAGSLWNFISHSVLLGFTGGAAVLIIFKQLHSLSGIHIKKKAAVLSAHCWT